MGETLRPKKALGQHFLTNPHICKRIVQYSRVGPGDTVLEIGPGTGALTEHLLAAAGAVIAVEFDRRMLDHLQSRFARHAHLDLILADALDLDWNEFLPPYPVKLVANLPYNISTRLLTNMAETSDRFQTLTFMVQKEVAERILAGPGSKDYGYLTLLMAYHFRRIPGFSVPPGVFRPPPKVESYVMTLEPHPDQFRAVSPSIFRSLIQTAFGHRRKTIWNNLKLRFDPGELGDALDGCGVSRTSRPEQINLEAFLCLCSRLSFPPENL